MPMCLVHPCMPIGPCIVSTVMDHLTLAYCVGSSEDVEYGLSASSLST